MFLRKKLKVFLQFQARHPLNCEEKNSYTVNIVSNSPRMLLFIWKYSDLVLCELWSFQMNQVTIAAVSCAGQLSERWQIIADWDVSYVPLGKVTQLLSRRRYYSVDHTWERRPRKKAPFLLGIAHEVQLKITLKLSFFLFTQHFLLAREVKFFALSFQMLNEEHAISQNQSHYSSWAS